MTAALSLPHRPGLVVTAAEALAHGWSYPELSRAVRRGDLHRLVSGAYVPRAAWEAWDDRARHVALARARVATREDGWALARRTAAVVHGVPLLGRLPAQPQLVRARGGGHASSRYERLATLPPGDVQQVAGLPVTTPARTAVDIARDEPFRAAVVAVDGLLREGAQPEELAEVLHRSADWPGARAAAAVLAFADGRAETVLESISRVTCAALGLPVFEPQVQVWCDGELLGRVDGLWAEWGVVGEADGLVKYGDREAVLAEKARQDRLDDLGLVVVRWGWDDTFHRTGTFAAKLERGRRRAATRTVDPAVRLVPTTLAEAQARARRRR
jgi:hypothetical protein